MILAGPGDPIWIPEGCFMVKTEADVCDDGLPFGSVALKPFRGILIERIRFHNDTYVKAYVDGIGERLIKETSIMDMGVGNG